MFFTEIEKEEIIDLYVNQKKPLTFIAQKFNCHFSTISNYLKKWNIKTRTPCENKKHFQDSSVFENIDSEEKAYWLGFLFADGYITKRNYIGLALSTEDITHIEKFKDFCKATNPIHIYQGNNFGAHSTYAKIEFKNEKMANDLISHGCTKNKSLILKPPINLPNNLIRHFLRGYFDGDGALCIGKYISFKVCGTKEFLKFFCESLSNYTKKEFVFKPFKRKKDEKNNYYISFGGKLKTFEAMQFLYNNAKIFLDRKHKSYTFLHNTVEPIRNDGC